MLPSTSLLLTVLAAASTAIASSPCAPDWTDNDGEHIIVGYHSQFGPQTLTQTAVRHDSDLGKPGKPIHASTSARDSKGWNDASHTFHSTESSASTSGRDWNDASHTFLTTKSSSASASGSKGWNDASHTFLPTKSSSSSSGSSSSSSTKPHSHATTSTTTTSSKPPHPTDSSSIMIEYSTVPNFFLQDSNATNPDGFDYATTNFGLINQPYDTDASAPSDSTQWQRFARKLADLQGSAGKGESYKLVFMGRHGEGNHNAMETYVGTPAWNCYWALLEGANSSFIYADAPVTSEGISQANKAHAYWLSRISEEKIPFIESYYSSPMRRCLETAELTFSGLALPHKYPFKPLIKEGLREGMSEHTCNRRSTRSWIAESYPEFKFEDGFTEEDELWTGITTEVPVAQDFRTKTMLDEIFSSDKNTYLSFTSHSGEIASILRVVGHRTFRLSTGQIIPVLIKAKTTTPEAATTTVTSAVWTPSPFCTLPPVTSVPSWGNGGGCVCQDGAEPTITQLPDFPVSQATPTA